MLHSEIEREGRGREEKGGEREKRREEGNGSDGRSGDQTYHANELEQQSCALVKPYGVGFNGESN